MKTFTGSEYRDRLTNLRGTLPIIYMPASRKVTVLFDEIMISSLRREIMVPESLGVEVRLAHGLACGTCPGHIHVDTS